MPAPRKWKPLREAPALLAIRQPTGETEAHTFDSVPIRDIAALRRAVRLRDYRPLWLHSTRFELIHFGDGEFFEGQVIIHFNGKPFLLCTFGTKRSVILWNAAVVPFLDDPENVPDSLWASYRQINGRSGYWMRMQRLGWPDLERSMLAYVYAALDEFHNPKQVAPPKRLVSTEVMRLGKLWDECDPDMTPLHAKYDSPVSTWDVEAKRAYWRWAEMRMLARRGYSPEQYRRLFRAWRVLRDREMGIDRHLPEAEKDRLRRKWHNDRGNLKYREKLRPLREASKAERAQSRAKRLKEAGIDTSLPIAEQNRLYAIYTTKKWREEKKAAGEWEAVRAVHRKGERRYEAANREKIVAAKLARRKQRLKDDPEFKARVAAWKKSSYERSKIRKSGLPDQPTQSEPQSSAQPDPEPSDAS